MLMKRKENHSWVGASLSGCCSDMIVCIWLSWVMVSYSSGSKTYYLLIHFNVLWFQAGGWGVWAKRIVKKKDPLWGWQKRGGDLNKQVSSKHFSMLWALYQGMRLKGKNGGASDRKEGSAGTKS